MVLKKVKKLVNKVLNDSIEGYVCYEYQGSYWIVNPETNRWVIKVAYSGYTFFNYFFFRNIFFYLSFDVVKNTKYISNWIISELGFSVSEHCYPDYLPGSYDWTKDFDVDKVIERGKIIARRPGEPISLFFR
jgi:hypothetical protein